MRLTIIFTLILLSISFLSSCGKTPDQKAYEEIVATMSMEKAKRFFDTYTQSRYREKLVTEIMEWCKQEETESCYRLAMEVLPKDHPRYKEVIAHYEKHFSEKGK